MAVAGQSSIKQGTAQSQSGIQTRSVTRDAAQRSDSINGAGRGGAGAAGAGDPTGHASRSDAGNAAGPSASHSGATGGATHAHGKRKPSASSGEMKPGDGKTSLVVHVFTRARDLLPQATNTNERSIFSTLLCVVLVVLAGIVLGYPLPCLLEEPTKSRAEVAYKVIGFGAATAMYMPGPCAQYSGMIRGRVRSIWKRLATFAARRAAPLAPYVVPFLRVVTLWLIGIIILVHILIELALF